MDEKCHKAQEIDLALFLLEPHGSDWQAFRAHYPHCATCSAEVQKWTSLELGLRTLGNVGDNGHPSADTLVAFQQKSPHLAPEEQFKIEAHLRSCAACRDEVKMLGSFDFSHVSQWRTDTKAVVSTEVRESWSTRIWNALRPLFLHPAFAAGLVLLLSVPFIRSYYLSSFNQAPLSSDLARTTAPAAAVGAAQGLQKPTNQLEEQQAAEPPPQTVIPAPSPQESAPVAPIPPVVESVPGAKKAKEDTRPTSLAKQPARREDFALKDERAGALPAASPPLIFPGADDRNRDTPVQWKSQAMVEEEKRQTFSATAAEREARSTEMLTPPRKRPEEDTAQSFSARSTPPQAAAPGHGNITSPESRYRIVLSSLLEAYKNAYELRDLNALGNVWRVDQLWRDALAQLFAQSQRIELSLSLAEDQITDSADERQILVPLSQAFTVVNQQGQTAKHGPFFCIADIRRQPTGTWIIHALQDNPQHPGQCRLP
jgi:hypothetical protein